MGPPVSEEMPDQQIPKVRTMGQEQLESRVEPFQLMVELIGFPKRGIMKEEPESEPVAMESAESLKYWAER